MTIALYNVLGSKQKYSNSHKICFLLLKISVAIKNIMGSKQKYSNSHKICFFIA